MPQLMKTRKNFLAKTAGQPPVKRGAKKGGKGKPENSSFFRGFAAKKEAESNTFKDSPERVVPRAVTSKGENYRLGKESRKFHESNFEDKKSEKSSFFIAKERDDFFEATGVKKSFNKSKAPSEDVNKTGEVRLNKHIANAGVCSRREADELISNGLISVNGVTVTEMGYKVKPGDKVQMGSKVLRTEKNVYFLLNKPKDYITTTDDPEDRKTVMELMKNACDERIYPVGRLDRNTTGLLVLTNDGDLAKKLTHPSHNIAKVYQVDLDKPFTNADLERLQTGIKLEDGPFKADDVAIVADTKTVVGIEIHEGRTRLVRRVFESLGYRVVKLDRVLYAGLTKKDLPRGHWRQLTEKEVVRLKHFI
jgi:23S rRNA pseudouridine2605 synthase